MKYTPGHFFRSHQDDDYVRPDNRKERSYLTILLYLNKDYKGGCTTFIKYENAGSGLLSRQLSGPDIVPGNVESDLKTGSLLIFQHDILHEGSLLREGTKYVVRTDVMYCLD